ncbi:MAG: EAL domain-containing protein [Rhizobiales bacterium]|nr:EAL domain-containing protein [Hyphomicrobiales bacterium]
MGQSGGAGKHATVDATLPNTAAILESVGEAAYQWQIDADTLAWGPNASQVLGLSDATEIASGRCYANLLDPGNKHTRFDVVMRATQSDDGKGVPYQIEYCLRAMPRRERLWIEDTGRWFADSDGRPLRAHGVIRVINDRYERDQKLAYLSRFDGLTGELNRWHLTEILESRLQEAERARSSCGFLLTAVDNLSRINEAYGYDVADEVIGAVAKRLRGKLRGEDCLGRFSGNKFGIILKDCSPDDMAVAANRLLACIRDDVVITTAGAVTAIATISGITMPRHAHTVHEVLARAQETLNAAKAKRPGSFLAYRPNVEREAIRRENVRYTDKIVTALNDRRILLAYEPVVESATRCVAFHECLMRIQCADGALIHAKDIVPIAERLGLIRLLDQRVLELAMAELAAAPELSVSLNASPASTIDPNWWTRLAGFLHSHHGVGERLIVEITEMVAIHDIDDMRGFVTRIKDLGCRIAIDDFGAGYTSFRNLRKLGVDIVKIDGAFVQNLVRSQDDCAFARAAIELAQRLGLSTVAEWVQDEKAAAMLTEWGCTYLQGALLGLASTERPWASAVASDAATA